MTSPIARHEQGAGSSREVMELYPDRVVVSGTTCRRPYKYELFISAFTGNNGTLSKREHRFYTGRTIFAWGLLATIILLVAFPVVRQHAAAIAAACMPPAIGLIMMAAYGRLRYWAWFAVVGQRDHCWIWSSANDRASVDSFARALKEEITKIRKEEPQQAGGTIRR